MKSEVQVTGYTGGHASPRKVCDENERNRKTTAAQKYFDDRKDFVWLLQKLDVIDFDEL